MAYDWMGNKRIDFSEWGGRQTKASVWVPTPYGEQRVSQEALTLMVAAKHILDKQGQMTLRGLYYALFGAGWIHNSDQAYNALKTILVDARKLGIVGWDQLEDATREPHAVQAWSDIRDFLKTVKKAYRRDVWQDQDTYVEVFIEKRTGVAQAKKVCRPYGITVNSGNGYGGWSSIYEAARRFGKMQHLGMTTVVLYVGDYDPSGLHMFFDFQERLRFFIDEGTLQEMPTFERIAVNDDDIEDYGLPEAPGKSTDSRAPWMVANYGKLVQVEMDALWSHTDENIFAEKVEAAIRQHIDMDAYEATLARETEEDALLEKAIDAIDFGDEA